MNKKGKIVAIIAIVLFIIAIVSVILYVYFFKSNRTSKIPEDIHLKCNIIEESFQDKKVFILTPKDKKKTKKVVFYLHGGSYVAELSKTHWKFLEEFTQETASTVIVVDYPLAPQYHYTDVFNMITPLYQETIKKVKPENLIVMGDSAGGGMALGLIEKLTIDKKDLPVKTILLSPWLDVRLKNEKIEKIEKLDPSLIKSALILAGRTYAGKDGMESYLVNPIDGPLKGIKNTYIFTGTYDILNPDVHIFMERARKENADIKLIEVEKAIHIWMTYRESNEEVYFANETFNDIVKLVKEEDENER